MGRMKRNEASACSIKEEEEESMERGTVPYLINNARSSPPRLPFYPSPKLSTLPLLPSRQELRGLRTSVSRCTPMGSFPTPPLTFRPAAFPRRGCRIAGMGSDAAAAPNIGTMVHSSEHPSLLLRSPAGGLPSIPAMKSERFTSQPRLEQKKCNNVENAGVSGIRRMASRAAPPASKRTPKGTRADRSAASHLKARLPRRLIARSIASAC